MFIPDVPLFFEYITGNLPHHSKCCFKVELTARWHLPETASVNTWDQTETFRKQSWFFFLFFFSAVSLKFSSSRCHLFVCSFPQARATDLKSCVVVLRILRDMCNRVAGWRPLKGWVCDGGRIWMTPPLKALCFLSDSRSVFSLFVLRSLWSSSAKRPSPPATGRWVRARLCGESWSAWPQGSCCQVRAPSFSPAFISVLWGRFNIRRDVYVDPQTEISAVNVEAKAARGAFYNTDKPGDDLRRFYDV